MLALAACGRFGFQAVAPDADATNTITVRVTSDEYLAEPAGLPIEGATVLVDHGGGVERATTDGTGSVTFPADGVVAYHVVYQSDVGWRIYTVAAPRPGAIELGSRPAFNLNRRMTLSVPAGTAADSYTAHLPERCGIVPVSSTPTFSFDFNPECDGQAMRMVAFRRRSTTDEYLDAATVMLVDGATYTVPGSYAVVPTRTIEFVRLPIGTSTVYADMVVRDGRDITRVSPNHDSLMTLGATGGTLITSAAPGGNALVIQSWYDLPLAYSSTSERIEPATIEDNTVFDGSAMLPLFTALTVNGRSSVSWTGGGTGGTIIAIEATAGMVQWNAYADPSATEVKVPVLPADLAVPMPATFAVVTVAKLDVPGATAADLATTLDRTWRQWPAVPELVPSSGSSLARILYIVGL